MSTKLFTSFFIIFIISSFPIIAQNHVYFNNLEDTPTNGNWLGINTIDSISAYSGNYFSATDSIKLYGLGIEQPFPAELIRKNTMVKISGYVKSNTINNNALFVVTLTVGGETVLWKGIPLAPVFTDRNTWYHFSDSVLIPANQTVNSILKAYLWNQDKTATTGIDDLRFEFKAISNPTFIPAFADEFNDKQNNVSKKVLFANDFYSIMYEDNANEIAIASNKNENIIKNIFYYSERKIKGEKYISESKLDFVKSKKTKDGTNLIFKVSKNSYKLELAVICKNNKPRIISF